jgi:hypothetical protein
MNLFNIERTFASKAKRRWKNIYWLIDVHDVILEGRYKLMNEGANYCPNALKVLRYLSTREDFVLILWTSSHLTPTIKIITDLRRQGVYFKYVNQNLDCPNDELCDFTGKPYFNIGLDDKFGFEGATDWFLIENELKRLGEWKT